MCWVVGLFYLFCVVVFAFAGFVFVLCVWFCFWCLVRGFVFGVLVFVCRWGFWLLWDVGFGFIVFCFLVSGFLVSGC